MLSKSPFRKIVQYFSSVTISAVLFLFILIIFRIYEAIEFQHLFEINLWSAFGPALGYDIKFSFTVWLTGGLIFLPFAIFHKNTAITLFNVWVIFFILIQLVLFQYFITNLSLLDNLWLIYDSHEIIFIIKTELSHVSWMFWIFLGIILVFGGWLLFSNILNRRTGKIMHRIILSIYFLGVSVCFIDFADFTVNPSRFNSSYNYFFANNKTLFLFSNLLKTLNKPKPEIEVSAVKKIIAYQKINSSFRYVNQTYPLLHDEPYLSALSPFFRKDKHIKPNLVFLIIESLSRSFSGPKAYYGSFTPFLDSLSAHSLYWENALSNALRTYGVFPNVFSSVPWGLPKAFINLNPYPKSESIIRLLKVNGYRSAFFYGCWGGFTGYDRFLKNSSIDYIIDNKEFDTLNYELPKNKKFVWGYYDHDLFNRSFEFLEKTNAEFPYLHIYLTIAMHSPNDMYPSEKYNEDYIQQLVNEKKIPANIHKSMQGNIITSVLYTDDILREFFKKYKMREEFKNTIFIIFGDHNISSIPFRNEMDVYHVPLMIYSPLLIKNDRLKGVVSHRDITPALLGLLEKNFGFNFPVIKHWLGFDLDTSHTFRNRNAFQLEPRSPTFPNYIEKDFSIKGDLLFKVEDNLELKRITNLPLLKEMQRNDSLYRWIDEYVCGKDMIKWK
ncbi:MAG: hypothetical protein A3H98_09250 [Bacteroidetes bacterium RIFCSPLOWO2_02_FULL_36_8]|nr:MAG: hypothetical protein A3H98_09250 [Bacteroidetes bacterium RIFCSPLOWO2_02_FULL_36_8]OFY69138.1 MAG: hypothetical protein A3G23_06215 [Bacteroidetes bacterium RIFCSPLOWO2_12_FULL_37_12]